MSKINKFKDRVNIIWTGILSILYILNIILAGIGKVLLTIVLYFILAPLYLFCGVAISVLLVSLSVGLIPLEIITFLIFGDTIIFKFPYDLIVMYWDNERYPRRLEEDILSFLDKSWIIDTI